MPRKFMLEVTQPFHKNGREVLYQPGYLFPPDAELPQGITVREVVADVPDEKPAAAKTAPAAKAAAKGEVSAP
jgi:hypothetical protein